MERTGSPGPQGGSLAWHLPSPVLLRAKPSPEEPRQPPAVPLTLQIRKLAREAAVALLKGLVLLVQEAAAVPQLLQLFCRGQAER